MKKEIFLLIFFILFFYLTKINGQNVTITDSTGYTAHSSAMLEVYSKTKGFLVPRTDTALISSPAKGLLVYDTTDVKFYFYSGTKWIDLATLGSGGDSIWVEDAVNKYVYLKTDTNKVGIGINNPEAKMEVQGDTINNAEDTVPLFVVKDKDGNEVFVVYPKGVFVYVDSVNNSTKELTNEQPTGFRVGRKTSGGTKDFDEEYFSISPYGVPDTIDPSEARILWYPEKEAFMAGKVLVEGADSVGYNSWTSGFESKSIGNYSQALGYQSIARGHYSTAIGYKAIAEGDYSFAFGDSSVAGSGGGAKGVANNCYAFGKASQAYGNNCFAFGDSSIANGDYSFSFGKNAYADNNNSFALGEGAHAKNDESYAIGRGAIAEGNRSFAFGSTGVDSLGQTTGVAYALGDYSFTFGQGSVSEGFGSFSLGIADTARGTYSLAAGNLTKSEGYASTALGYSTFAEGNFSTTIGYYSNTYGAASTAIGGWCSAYGDLSIAGGYDCQTSGGGAIALGYGDSAAGAYSFAAGHGSVATNTASIAIGYTNLSTGVAATALGHNTVAQSSFSLVIGKNNVIFGDPDWAGVDTDPVFVIGNGNDSDHRSNAMTVLKNGYTGLGIENPDQRLDVNGNIRLRGNIYDYYNTYGSSGDILMRGTSGVMWTSTLPVHEHGVSDVTSGYFSVSKGGTGRNLLTSGKVLVGNGTTEVLMPTNLHWDNTNSRLGIGTSSPSQILDVSGHMRLQGFLYDYNNSKGITGQVLMRSSSGVTWSSNLYWDSSNSRLGIGLGADSADQALEINGDLKFSGQYFHIYNQFNRKIIQQGWTGSWYNYTAMNSANDWLDANAPGSVITSITYPLIVTTGSSGTPYATTLMTVHYTGAVNMPYVYSSAVGGTNLDLFIDNTGKIGYVSSSLRYKKNVNNMENIDWLYRLRPVNYFYKNDSLNKKQYGLIAEEVEKVNPLFVSYNADGTVETVQYSQLISPMLKAIQDQQELINKLLKQNQEFKTQINNLESEVAVIKRNNSDNKLGIK